MKFSQFAFFSIAITIFFAAAFASKAPASPVAVPGQTICLKDDSSLNFISWNTATGVYTVCAAAQGVGTGGLGKVGLVNGIQTLTDNQPDRRISAGFFTGQLTGKATVVVRQAPGIWQTITISDTNPVPPASCPCTIMSGSGSDISLLVFLGLVACWLGWRFVRRSAPRPKTARS